MKRTRRDCRFTRVMVCGVALALAALLSAGCSSPGAAPSASPSPVASETSVSEVQAVFGEAARALLDGDKAAYRTSVPAEDASVRQALDDLYRTLAPLPWTEFTLSVTAIPGRDERFAIKAVGRLAGAGPSDRLAGYRAFVMERRDGVLTAVRDETPADARRQYLMAFRNPVVVRANGLVVVSDRKGIRRARELAAAGRAARGRLKDVLGIGSREPVFVALYSSTGQLRAALGDAPPERRIKFFSNATPRLSSAPWRVRDIGVLSPMLKGAEDWIPLMLAHELTHAYTVRWFEDTEHAPSLLLEGLATAVEGGRDFGPLREEVAAGNTVWPLVDALATGDLWMGSSTEHVRLAYLEGASLVYYVIDGWGLSRLQPFCMGIADSALTRADLDRVCRRVLDVSWNQFYRDWKTYVRTSL